MIWGFPLFKINATVSNWPRWGSGLGSKYGYNGNEGYGNENMLLDISHNRNIIVLDFDGYNLKPGVTDDVNCLDVIKNFHNTTDDGFYLTLRLKNSTETELKSFQPYNGQGNNRYGWATLVQYEYECDIIGPRNMLDFSFHKFSYIDSGIANLFGQNLTKNTKSYKLIFEKTQQENFIFGSFKFSILTGLGISGEELTDETQKTQAIDNISNWINEDRRMDTEQIFDNLINDLDLNKYLQTASVSNGRIAITKLIGGGYHNYDYTNGFSNLKGYYPNDNLKLLNTKGWNTDSILQNNSSNNGRNKKDNQQKDMI